MRGSIAAACWRTRRQSCCGLLPDDLLEVVEIGPEIGNPRNEGPELQQPLRPRLL